MLMEVKISTVLQEDNPARFIKEPWTQKFNFQGPIPKEIQDALRSNKQSYFSRSVKGTFLL